jgi:hypothetical protein
MLMKKALLIGLALGLVCAWAVPATAIDWSASGYIMVLGNLSRNMSMIGAGGWTNTTAIPDAALYPGVRVNENGGYMAMQAHLGITARASEDLYGFFKFEMDSRRFGEAGGGGGTIGAYGADQVAVEVKNVFIDFRVPPQLPVWLRIGVQPYAIRPHVFMYADAAGVTGRIMIDPIKMMIRPMYAKVNDPDDCECFDGAEFYAIDMSLPVGPVTPGMFFTYNNVRSSTGVVDSQQLWWIGGYVDGMVGPIKAGLDFIYSGGEVDNRAPTRDQDVGSWLLRGVVSFVWNKLEVGVGGMYVQGEDQDSNDIETFQLPRNFSETRPINGDLMVFNDGWMGSSGWHRPGLITGPGTNWPGFWNVRGFVYYQVLDWLKVGAQLAYIGDTQEGTAGTAGIDALGTDNDDDDSIGWEMAFGTNVNIYKNLSLNTAFGYLIAHKALSLTGGEEPHDPWVLASVLRYSF